MRVNRLEILRPDLDVLFHHAENCFPQEAVALLFGKIVKDVAIVRRIELLENIAHSSTKFEVDPVIEYHLLLEAEKRKEELIGIFHSHYTHPIPSPSDRKNMKLNPVVWVIGHKKVREWHSRCFVFENSVREIPLCIKSVEFPI